MDGFRVLQSLDNPAGAGNPRARHGTTPHSVMNSM